MLLRYGLRFGMAVALVIVALVLWHPLRFGSPHAPTQNAAAQTAPPPAAPAQNAPASAAPPAAAPAAPAETPAQDPDSGLTTKPTDPFGVDMTLTAKPIVYVKGSSTWDKAFDTISGGLKKVEAYAAKNGIKTDGQPMTIFTATDDAGFDYEAALPLTEPPKNTAPHDGIYFGATPEGRALEFVHRGTYEALDDTYEAITNYLDGKRLESRNILIEQYQTDPATTPDKNLVIDVLVLVK